jgi:hypothetical protein
MSRPIGITGLGSDFHPAQLSWFPMVLWPQQKCGGADRIAPPVKWIFATAYLICMKSECLDIVLEIVLLNESLLQRDPGVSNEAGIVVAVFPDNDDAILLLGIFSVMNYSSGFTLLYYSHGTIGQCFLILLASHMQDDKILKSMSMRNSIEGHLVLDSSYTVIDIAVAAKICGGALWSTSLIKQ